MEERREFIRQYRAEITEEMAEGMPTWNVEPEQPFVISTVWENLWPFLWRHQRREHWIC